MSKLKTKISPTVDETAGFYNEIPYESDAYYFTRPEFLKSAAHIFKVDTPALEKARILEIGCAGGLNMLVFAQTFPNSYSLGVDISSAHIEQAEDCAKKLDLKNVEFKCFSVADLDSKKHGTFDYIICHGVFSWVPEAIREDILRVAKNLLNPNGVVFVSYNTLPGWNMVNTIREMKLFHGEIFNDMKDKISQGKLFLKFITDSFANNNASYATFLKEEILNLSSKGDSYIRHEYFSEENNAFYFRDFAKMANNHKLAYLCEALVSTMYIGNLPESMQKQLATVPDIIRLEQYLDFITNKRFRCTLLCHDDVKINRNVESNILEDLWFTARVTSRLNEHEIDFEDNDVEIKYYNFLDPANDTFLLSAKFAKSKIILWILENNIGNPLNKKEIIDLAHKKLPKYSKEELAIEFNTIILPLIFNGHIQYFISKPNFKYTITKKPKINPLNILMAEKAKEKGQQKFNIFNQLSEAYSCASFQIPILLNLNGKNTVDEIKEIYLQKIKIGEITANNDKGEPITDEFVLKNICSNTVDNILESFRKIYLLIG